MNTEALETAKEVVAEVNAFNDHVGEIGEYAIVEKAGDHIHLEFACNVKEEDYTIEQYDSDGWWVDVKDINKENFWDIWTTWNGYMCGGIYLDDCDFDDNEDTTEWNNFVAQFREVSIEELKELPDGKYAVYV